MIPILIEHFKRNDHEDRGLIVDARYFAQNCFLVFLKIARRAQAHIGLFWRDPQAGMEPYLYTVIFSTIIGLCLFIPIAWNWISGFFQHSKLPNLAKKVRTEAASRGLHLRIGSKGGMHRGRHSR